MASFMRVFVLLLATAVLGTVLGCGGGLEQADAPSKTPPGATMVNPEAGAPSVPGGPSIAPPAGTGTPATP